MYTQSSSIRYNFRTRASANNIAGVFNGLEVRGHGDPDHDAVSSKATTDEGTNVRRRVTGTAARPQEPSVTTALVQHEETSPTEGREYMHMQTEYIINTKSMETEIVRQMENISVESNVLSTELNEAVSLAGVQMDTDFDNRTYDINNEQSDSTTSSNSEAQARPSKGKGKAPDRFATYDHANRRYLIPRRAARRDMVSSPYYRELGHRGLISPKDAGLRRPHSENVRKTNYSYRRQQEIRDGYEEDHVDNNYLYDKPQRSSYCVAPAELILQPPTVTEASSIVQRVSPPPPAQAGPSPSTILHRQQARAERQTVEIQEAILTMVNFLTLDEDALMQEEPAEEVCFDEFLHDYEGL
ncbi:hypothetical protein H0H92_013132 [Tricholoma furcatifolium]|nr:hypothetical protein H0H92_013132 [Tricholoma furcatifolium]